MLNKTPTSSNQQPLVNPKQARWVHGVLGMLIAVVGKDTMLGMVLGQTQREVRSLVEVAEQGTPPSWDSWYLDN
jgi:hypothetical protein